MTTRRILRLQVKAIFLFSRISIHVSLKSIITHVIAVLVLIIAKKHRTSCDKAPLKYPMFEDQEPEGRVSGGAPLFKPLGDEFQGWTKSYGASRKPISSACPSLWSKREVQKSSDLMRMGQAQLLRTNINYSLVDVGTVSLSSQSSGSMLSAWSSSESTVVEAPSGSKKSAIVRGRRLKP